jgi:uncharacterized protein YhaN
VNVIELLAHLQAQQAEAEAATRAGELRDQIEHLNADLSETEVRLAELVTTRKVIAELAPTGTEPEPPELTTTYQVIVNAFNTHPNRHAGSVIYTNSSACAPTTRP